jgi:hypothetical protein
MKLNCPSPFSFSRKRTLPDQGIESGNTPTLR